MTNVMAEVISLRDCAGNGSRLWVILIAKCGEAAGPIEFRRVRNLHRIRFVHTLLYSSIGVSSGSVTACTGAGRAPKVACMPEGSRLISCSICRSTMS